MSKKILVVDDEKLIVKGIRFSLEQEGMEVDCAYDGEEALEYARRCEYDLVLLDVMLPEYRIASFLNGSLDFEEYSNVLNKLNTVRRSTHIKCAKCWGRVACDICPAYLLFASEEVKDNYCKTEKELQKKLLLKCAGN